MKFNVHTYGALPDGSLCTSGLQRAIDDCFLQGGGEVVVPGGVYVTGGLRLRTNVTLHLMKNAVLCGSTAPEDYTGYINDSVEPIPEEERDQLVPTALPEAADWDSVHPYRRWNNAIIRAVHAKNIAIIGEPGSEINGQNCFDPQGEEGYRGPHAVNFWFCENVTLSGYTVRDSANWAHAIQNSKHITARNLTVLGGHDGFDVRTCDDIRIEGCVFRTGDDCIAGFDNINVTVRDCIFDTACSMLRFGGTDVLVENCRGIAPATYAFRGSLNHQEKMNRMPTNETHRRNCLNVFLYYCDHRAQIRKAPGNIVIRNCSFRNPDAVMRLPFGHIWCCNRSLADITFENCTFDGVCMPIRLNCPENEPLSLRMKDCSVTAREGAEGIDFIQGEHVKQIRLERVKIEKFNDPPIVCHPETEILKQD